MEKLFFELLRVAVGQQERLSRTPTREEWCHIQLLAQKQSLTGIAFFAVKQLPQEQWPGRDVLLSWMAIAHAIEQRNVVTTQVCQELCQRYAADGFDCCILKGQANHRYYDERQANLRISGDVDIWVVPRDKTCQHPVATVIDRLQSGRTVESLCYLHAEVKPVRHVPVEVHLRPSFMNAPWRNRRFLHMFQFANCVKTETVDGVQLPVLKTSYDVIFQLNHLYRHLIDEGVGLRQVLDYYWLLLAWNRERNVSARQLMTQVERLGMKRFARALMYVLREVFSLPSDSMLCKPSEKDGRFLLDEMMAAGNFGHYDLRMADINVRKGNTSYQVQRAYRRCKRNLRFLTSYPEEVCCEPFARLMHFWWRKFQLWRH